MLLVANKFLAIITINTIGLNSPKPMTETFNSCTMYIHTVMVYCNGT